MTGHSHAGAGGAAEGAERAGACHLPPLRIAFALTATFLAVEAVTVLLTGSPALLSDAGLMLTGATGGLATVWAVISPARRWSRQRGWAFGWYRFLGERHGIRPATMRIKPAARRDCTEAPW